MSLKRRQKGRPPNMGLIKPDALYSGPRPLKSSKVKDLLGLLCYVPPVHHAFYHQLPFGEEVDDKEVTEEVSDTESSAQEEDDSDQDQWTLYWLYYI